MGAPMRITSRGQITIPRDIRERLGLLPGADLELEVEGDEVRLRRRPAAAGRGKRLVEHMRGRLRGGMRTDEVMALTRGEDDGTILV